MSLLAIPLVALAGAPAPPPVIEIEGPRIEASELAGAVSGWADSNAVVAQSPSPGIVRRVSRSQLELWARRAGLPAGGLPETLLLRRRMRLLSADEAESLLTQALGRTAAVEAGAVEVQLESFAETEIPAGELELRVGGALYRLNEPTRVFIRWREPDGRSGVEPVEATLRIRGRYLQATTDVPAGALAEPGDFAVVDGYLPDLRTAYVADASALVGKKLTRPLRRGERLRADQLAERPAVERGDVLELTVVRGAIRLRAPARAESSGSRGDLVSVRNLATNARVQARVSGRGAVEAIVR